jgi:hypothetical protein
MVPVYVRADISQGWLATDGICSQSVGLEASGSAVNAWLSSPQSMAAPTGGAGLGVTLNPNPGTSETTDSLARLAPQPNDGRNGHKNTRTSTADYADYADTQSQFLPICVLRAICGERSNGEEYRWENNAFGDRGAAFFPDCAVEKRFACGEQPEQKHSSQKIAKIAEKLSASLPLRSWCANIDPDRSCSLRLVGVIAPYRGRRPTV